MTVCSTSKLTQPDLLCTGNHGVAEVIEGEATGHLQGKIADHEGQEGQDVLGALSILIIGVYRGADDCCGCKLGCHLQTCVTGVGTEQLKPGSL